MSPELPIALLAGVVLGASAHRAGLCTVKAVAELLTTRRAHVLWSFIKASLWTTGLLSAAALFGTEVTLGQRPLLASAVLGGLFFGMGAALNGACSFSTLSRLAEGHLVILATLAGWAVAIPPFATVWPDFHQPVPQAGIPRPVVLPLFLWMLWELTGLWRRRRPIAHSIRAGAWALSLAVFLIALANSALILAGRPWSFTSTALCSAGNLPIAPCRDTGFLWLISGTALMTMIASARLRGSFRLRPPRPAAAVRHFLGGLAMGTGASLIPGGNDGLILFGLPALSPHALPAWLAIVAGIALPLTLMRRLGLHLPKISCEGDVCRSLP
ncbi:MAG: YeeE/YedE thiosulfate transporter family protein [Pseudomonadota bacterium]